MCILLQFVTNPVCLSIILITFLGLSGLSVPLALVFGAIVAGLLGGVPFGHVVEIFSEGISGGANIALSYAFLGMFAVGLTTMGLPELLVSKITDIGAKHSPRSSAYCAMAFLLICGIFSQTIIPVHIAFIPIVVPALISLFNKANVDRRSIACVLTFGLVATYNCLPFGFGEIFLREIVVGNLNAHGIPLAPSNLEIMRLTAIPTAGMIFGLIVAVCASYRHPRRYKIFQSEVRDSPTARIAGSRAMVCGTLAIVTMLTVQIAFRNMAIGALLGFSVLLLSGVLRWKDSDKIVVRGFGMMASIGMVMIIAAGFSAVLSHTGAIDDFVNSILAMTGDNTHLTIIFMLTAGLVITMGIGSSFSTVPIISAIFIPICQKIGLSMESTFILLAVSGALGDTGSMASDSTLGATGGLNIDGQHNHFRDTVIPTFIHFNIPQLIFGYIAVILFS
jgi:predicted histidine transporter YuiF (NhaC family)